jgi:ParB family transcriptional regulator, chromosome partitioning protein
MPLQLDDLALGDNQAEIAERLGKSRQWVTLATALIEPPDWLLQAYREGRGRGTNELYDLRRLHGEHGEAVEAWAAGQPTITRERLTQLRAALERSAAATSTVQSAVQSSSDTDATATDRGLGITLEGQSRPAAASDATPGTVARFAGREASTGSDRRVHVEFEGQDYQLVVSVVPDQAGCMYVRPLIGAPRRLAPVASLKLLGFVGGLKGCQSD